MDNSSLKNLALPNDLLILGRGFRDALKDFKIKHGLITKAPACKILND